MIQGRINTSKREETFAELKGRSGLSTPGLAKLLDVHHIKVREWKKGNGAPNQKIMDKMRQAAEAMENIFGPT